MRNAQGGKTCYQAQLRSGSNVVGLRLVEKKGKNTKLKMSVNNGEYESTFSGTKDHVWQIAAPW